MGSSSMLPLPLLPLKREEISHSPPAPAQSPSPGWQSIPNFCSMDPSPQLHFFTNAAAWVFSLECSSSGTGYCNVEPPWVHKPWWETSPAWTLLSPDPQVLPEACPMGSLPPLGLTSSSSESFGGCSVLLWTSMGTAGSPCLSPWTARESLVWHLEQLFPILLHWPW